MRVQKIYVRRLLKEFSKKQEKTNTESLEQSVQQNAL